MQNLKDFSSIKLWLSKASGSINTEKVYLRAMLRFLDYIKISNPDSITKEWKEIRYDYRKREMYIDKMAEQIEEFTLSLTTAPKTKRRDMMAVVSFFKHNRIPIVIDVGKIKVYPIYHDIDITEEQIKRILKHVALRERTFYLFMLESGLRPNTIAELKYMDIKEDYEINRIPMQIKIRQDTLKNKQARRFSFIGQDAFNSLKELLSTIEMEDDSYIFQSKVKDKRKCLRNSMSNIFKRVVLDLGMTKTNNGKPSTLRLYSLRKYFRNTIQVDSGYREFWMSHSLGVDASYISKNPEIHRKKYEKAYPSLRIYSSSKTSITKEIKNKLSESKTEIQLLKAKIKELEDTTIPKEELRGIVAEELQKMLDDVNKEYPKK